MYNNTTLFRFAKALPAFILIYSCQRTIDQQAPVNERKLEVVASARDNGVLPYKFERINEQNFTSQGWKEQQVNNSPIAGEPQIFSQWSDYVEIVRGPENNSDPRLIRGCITMNLPTSSDPTLRRVRLRRGGYSGTLIKDLTELKFSTYVVQNAPVSMVLQIDVTGDDAKDFNIYYEAREKYQEPGAPAFILNQWQQWNALTGIWHAEAVTISGVPSTCTIPQLITLFPNARIIDTPPEGHNGEGVRFTIGGNPRSDFDNTIGYFDALIIGTRNEKQSTLYDFTSSD